MTEPSADQAQIARTALLEILDKMGFPTPYDVTVAETTEQITLTVTSEHPLGPLIGKGGQTLNAIELVLRAIVQHQTHSYGKLLVVDAEGYRQRHAERLEELARAKAQQVLESGETVALEPMNSRDRRTVHMAISQIDGVATYSAGEEPYRHIVICLPGQEQDEEE